MKYPRKLSAGANNMVIAISETEVAKLFLEDTRSDIGSEAEKMKFANTINGLVTQFIRLDFDETIGGEMLVMERIYPIDFMAYEVEKRQLWCDVFEDELLNSLSFSSSGVSLFGLKNFLKRLILNIQMLKLLLKTFKDKKS